MVHVHDTDMEDELPLAVTVGVAGFAEDEVSQLKTVYELYPLSPALLYAVTL